MGWSWVYIILEGGDASDNLSNFLNLKFKLEEKSNIQGNTSIHTFITILAHLERNGDTKLSNVIYKKAIFFKRAGNTFFLSFL